MIRVQKPVDPPKKLLVDGVAKTNRHCIEYDSEPKKYRSGEKKFEIDRAIYGDKNVKESLMRLQFNKCCYCENRINTSYGDVEHFRPKGSVRQICKSGRRYPGYYWLSYDWMNLYYSCEQCNRSYKKDLFPLVDDCERVRDHHGNLDRERPLLVDPGGVEDPRDHIRFHQEIPVHRTEQGRVTIESIGLDRSALNETRKKHLDNLKRAREIVKFFPLLLADNPDALQVIQEARNFLNSAVKACAIFSSMARDLLAEEQ